MYMWHDWKRVMHINLSEECSGFGAINAEIFANLRFSLQLEFFSDQTATRYFFLKLGRVFQFPLKSYGHISHNYFFRFIRKKRRDFSENLRLINNISREITRQKWSYDECNVYVDKILMFLGGSNTNQSTGRAYWERDFRKISFFPRHYTFLLICSKETSNSNQKDPPSISVIKSWFHLDFSQQGYST